MPFEVTQVNGIWIIPSHSNYPADASKQMADAAASLIDIKKLGIASTNPAEHETFGVIDPTSSDLSAGSRGVGKKVVIQDGGGNLLAQFILGKTDSSQTGMRWVRIPGQDPVYRVIMDTDKLTTKFGDWIEKDLLKLNVMDVRQLSLNDYSVDEARGVVEQRALINVGFDPKDSKWQLGSMEVFKDKKGLVHETLGPNRGAQQREAQRAEECLGRSANRGRQPQAGRFGRRSAQSRTSWPRIGKPRSRWHSTASTWSRSISRWCCSPTKAKFCAARPRVLSTCCASARSPVPIATRGRKRKATRRPPTSPRAPA